MVIASISSEDCTVELDVKYTDLESVYIEIFETQHYAVESKRTSVGRVEVNLAAAKNMLKDMLNAST